MKTKELNIVVVGTGYWGKNLVRNFSKLGVLFGLCDINPDQTKQLSELYKVPSFTWNEVLTNTSINAVVIATPASLHFTLSKEALLSDKHVFVEKPLALKVEDAQLLCALSKKQQRTLMVGHLLQHHPAFLKLKAVYQNGMLGNLKYIHSNRLNLGKVRHEEDVLWSFAPHDISMILALLNSEPNNVSAVGEYYLNKNIADVTTMHLSFPNNINARIFVSWLYPYKEQKLVLVGEKGMLLFDDSRSFLEKLTFYDHSIELSDPTSFINKDSGTNIPVDQTEPLYNECQHFIDCIQNNIAPRTDGEEGLRVLKILNQATRSLQDRK